MDRVVAREADCASLKCHAIPGGLGNLSCAVKKLCCEQLCCGRPAGLPSKGSGSAGGLPAGRPRAVGRTGGCQREPAPVSPELGGSECVYSATQSLQCRVYDAMQSLPCRNYAMQSLREPVVVGLAGMELE